MRIRAGVLAVPAAALIALSGCAETNDSDAPDPAVDMTPEEVIADAQAALDEAGYEMKPGLYAIGSNGQIYAQTQLNSDLSYVDYSSSNVRVGGGTWEADGDTFCLTPRGDDGEVREERCWDNGPASDDGSFTTTLTDGSESYQMTPLSE